MALRCPRCTSARLAACGARAGMLGVRCLAVVGLAFVVALVAVGVLTATGAASQPGAAPKALCTILCIVLEACAVSGMLAIVSAVPLILTNVALACAAWIVRAQWRRASRAHADVGHYRGERGGPRCEHEVGAPSFS